MHLITIVRNVMTLLYEWINGTGVQTTFHLVSSIKGKIRPSRITHCIRILRNLFIPGGWWVVVQGHAGIPHNLVEGLK